MKRGFAAGVLVLVTVAITGGCGGGGTSVPPPPPPNIAVNISFVGDGVLEAGQQLTLTAQTPGDTSGKGVTWSITPPSGAGKLTNATSTSVTYVAPPAPPASNLAVTITATSVADPSKFISAGLDVAAISVNLTTPNGQLEAGGNTVITATVNDDPANKGVDPKSWTLTDSAGMACSPGCGTLSNQTSSSATYNAPAAPPVSSVNLTIAAKSLTDPRQSGQIGITFQAIIVSLSANPGSLQAQGTSTITATVSFDPANQGVGANSWTLTDSAGAACSPGCGTLSSQTASTATYTAPAAPPPSNLVVTITATSISAPQQMGSTTVTVLAITIKISPTSALVPVQTGAVQFTGTVANDPSVNPQVSFSLSQNGIACASPTCGTFSAAAATSGTAVTYMAPTTMPASPTVTVTATSVTDNTKSVSATVTLTNGTVELVPNSLDFGNVKTNQSKSQTITLTNTGASALTINSVTATPGVFTISKNTCGSNGANLAASASCTLTITFKPVNAVMYNGTLTITDSSSDSPQKVPLSGTGSIRIRLSQPALDVALSANKAANSPVPTGPSPVGTRVLDFIDSSRNDPFLANGTKRELLVRMWYPAAAAGNCPRAEYTSPQVWDEFSRLINVPLPHVTTNSCWNLPVADGTHPVVVFTHGYTGTFTDYTFLFEDLASRGYVVASVDHTFEATGVEFPDGRFARGVFGSYFGTDARADLPAMDFALSVRLSDLKFVLDQLESLNTGADAQLAGKLDISRIALAGHSFGGLATILSVEEDPRFRAAIVIDGVAPNSFIREMETPMLLLAAGRDIWSSDENNLWRALRGPRLAVNLLGSEHVTTSDLTWLAAGAVKSGSMGPENTMGAARHYVAAFLDAYLLGKNPDALLSGPSLEYRDAIVTTQKQELHAKE